jgi:hypothetical protein
MRLLHHSSLFRGAVSVAIFGVAAIAACSAGTTDSLTGRGSDSNATGVDPGTASTGTSGATSDGTNSTSDTSGTTPTNGETPPAPSADAGLPPDGGAPPPPPTDAFTGAGAFVAQSGGSGHHNAGQNCMAGCHNHGFTFAGTLFDAAGAAVSSAEIRLVDANGKAILVHSGTNGNFYSSTPWTSPAKVAARTATSKVVMVGALATASNGGCNGCHTTGGTAPKIHVP